MIAVQADNISKVYKLYKKPVHRLLEALRDKPMHTAFRALENVSFTVPIGSTLGLIGENGAGKSTLLKILAKTLTPTSGELRTEGRVAALLELGAGFHQEFTGRQNIYLNASLMGLTEAEIKYKEQEIIDFAELGEFIDRPIRTYSSGMVVRLGFSIATSVDPDILVVDEALSVGDQRFQEKCIHRMQGFRREKKTIIVCSHSMYLINALCSTCIWIDRGRIRESGATEEVISKYVAYLDCTENSPDQEVGQQEAGAVEAVVEDIQALGEDERPVSVVYQFKKIVIKVSVRCFDRSFKGHIGVVLEDAAEASLFAAYTGYQRSAGVLFSSHPEVSLILPHVNLQKGSLYLRAIISDEHGMRLVDQKRVGPLPIISKHPECGLFWMEHEWRI